MPDTTGVVGTLTDGTGVSKITLQKLVKDLVYDFLTGSIAGFGTGAITGIQDAVTTPLPVAFGLANAAIAAIVRITLRWAAS